MKRIVLNVALVVLLFGLAPAVLLAEDEITLERVRSELWALAERVTAIEAKIAPVTTDDGACIQYAERQVQRETVTRYFDAFDENLESNNLRLVAISYETESGLTVYYIEEYFTDRSVTETWRGCEFLDIGEWVEED